MADNYTRRAFFTSQPIRDAVEDGIEADGTSDDQSEQLPSVQAASESDGPSTEQSGSWLVLAVVRVAAVAILLIALSQLAGAGLANGAAILAF